MTRRDIHDRLDPEERALADALSRTGPQGGPSEALDKRILAAAHAAAGASPKRARVRMPVVLGIAASLVVAFVLAVQLRPLLDPAPAPASGMDGVREEAAAAMAADETAPAPQRDLAVPEAAPVTPAPVPDAEVAPARSGAADSTRAMRPAEPALAPAPPPPPPPPAAPMAAPDAFPTSPPPPAGDVAATDARGALRQRTDAREPERGAELESERARAAMRGDGASDAAAQSAEAEAVMAPSPASGGLEARRIAELDHIRALRDAGELEAARAALAAWRQRWPGAPVPDDLRPLAE